jgi:hypothetical protein
MNRTFLRELYLDVNFFILLEGEVSKESYLRVFLTMQVVFILKRWVVFHPLVCVLPLAHVLPLFFKMLALDEYIN